MFITVELLILPLGEFLACCRLQHLCLSVELWWRWGADQHSIGFSVHSSTGDKEG